MVWVGNQVGSRTDLIIWVGDMTGVRNRDEIVVSVVDLLAQQQGRTSSVCMTTRFYAVHVL